MAIIRTGAIYKSLQFGGVDSRDYGIYITGAAVYNAPERDVELVNVPGRNGAIILDNGHWNNIEVAYPAGSFAPDQATFAANFAAFRNAIVSQVGYQRLTDGYNTGEYRIAAYLSGLEVDPAGIGQAGQFEIRFNCKPQRFLTSGETLQTVAASGDTVTNPTLYESSPLIVAEGYGKIGFNGYQMEIFDTGVGSVTIAENAQMNAGILADEVPTWTFRYNTDAFETGDTITVSGLKIMWMASTTAGNLTAQWVHITPSGDTQYADYVRKLRTAYQQLYVNFVDFSLQVGTNATIQISYASTIGAYPSSGTGADGKTEPWTGTATVTHDATAGTITVTFASTLNLAEFNADYAWYQSQIVTMDVTRIGGTSTKPTVSDPIYIDTEIGEAYTVHGGEVTSLNSSVSIGSDLPVLAPGANAVTFDNTITALSIAGRWWQL